MRPLILMLRQLSGATGLSIVLGALSRFQRRQKRSLDNFLKSEAKPLRGGVALLVGGFLVATFATGMIVGERGQILAATITRGAGLAIGELRIEGTRFTSDAQIAGALGIGTPTTTMLFDADETHRRLLDLPWVETASVRKVYPDAVSVTVNERTAAANWLLSGRRVAIDAAGDEIAETSPGVGTLPLLVGRGANESGLAMVDAVAAYPRLAERVIAYLRVGQRRWDLRLDNGVTIRLPENGQDEALARIGDPALFTDLMARDVKAVDLRLPGRMVLQVSEETVESRAKALKEIEKQMSRAARERKI